MNFKYLYFALCLFLGIAIGYSIHSYFSSSSIQPIFSPSEGNQIIDLISNAKESIYIQTYVFNSDDVLEALISAKNRGVKIEVIIEPRISGNDNSKMYSKLASSGINVRYASTKFQLTHAKFIIIDGKIVVVGSHNLTYSALNKNREASVAIYSDSIASSFMSIFTQDWLSAT